MINNNDLSGVVLVCPVNDAESVLILMIASRLGMRVITSRQGVGATLEAERLLEELIILQPCSEVWIVEIPGPDTEARIAASGKKVVIIDHHKYTNLDRTLDPEGQRLPSSLEQFMKLVGLNGRGLPEMGFAVKETLGIGIFDDRYAQGLRDEGYSPKEIRRVLAFREKLILLMNPAFDTERKNARAAWDKRVYKGAYAIIRAQSPAGIRGEVGYITILEDCDLQPLVIIEVDAEDSSRAVFVQNVNTSLVDRLHARFGAEGCNSFTYGAGKCWGTDNKNGTVKAAPIDEIFHMLGL